ncbi:hypothetical protein BJ742DRAFT_867983 [Cladochytrium replicatum]|nr:hypothetical protein BJ742DRAFT_867983 [Cladochytrium replicatum]
MTAIVSGGTGQIRETARRAPLDPLLLLSHLPSADVRFHLSADSRRDYLDALRRTLPRSDRQDRIAHRVVSKTDKRLLLSGSAEAFRNLDLDTVLILPSLQHSFGAHTFVLVSSQFANKDSCLLHPRTKGEAKEVIAENGVRNALWLQTRNIDCEREKGRFLVELARRAAPYSKWVPGSQIETFNVAKAMIVLRLDEPETSGAGRIILNDEMIGIVSSTRIDQDAMQITIPRKRG